MMAAEQRRDPRVQRPFMLRYRSLHGAWAPWSITPVRDLSASGARFLSEHPLSVGARVELHLVLPASQQPVLLEGQVAWVKAKGAGRMGLMEVGVSFSVRDDATQQLLEAAVRHFLRRA